MPIPKLFDFLKDITEKTKAESNKKVLLIYALGLAVIFVIYVAFFLKPGIATLAGLLPKIRERGSEIKAVRDDLPFKDKLLEKRKAQTESLGTYEEKLSKEKELPVLLENLSQIARNSHVKMLGITPLNTASPSREKDQITEDGIYQEVPIRISGQSGYHELGAFINELERSKRYLQVSNLKIQTNNTNPKRHNVEFVVYAYTFKSGE